ncbi:MAG: hypothetical protein LW834_19975 [Cyanobium sp. 49614_E6]|nr:hypothetical protein [Cyanobium sp. 49614_E6]
MSRVDTVFGPIPGPMIQEWGLDATFVTSGAPGTYDPATGKILDTSTRTPVKVVITKINPQEYQGLYQATDVKIFIDPAQLGGHYITTADSFEYQQAGTTIHAKVINPVTFRGDNPVLFACVARPQ